MTRITDSTPIKDGYRMPAEFAPHDGTIMIYPTRPGSWGKDRSGALKAFGEIFLEILKRENLYLLAAGEYWDEARDFLDELIDNFGDDDMEDRCLILPIDSDDAWARDVGPTIVTRSGRDIRGVNWRFNAWGGEVDGLYASWDKDDKVAEKFCDMCEIDYYDAAPFVLEGGSIHSDGEGTVMVTESCLLSKGRNPGLTREQIEDTLKTYLGAEKVLWLPRGIYNDETNEHVDNVCAFTAPGEVVLAWTDNREDPQYEMSLACLNYLESVTDAAGRQIKVHKLPVPEHPVLVCKEDLDNYVFEEGEDTREVGERLAASYVNFYFVNGAALVPQFGGENRDSDRRALDILRSLLPDREVIGIDAREILLGGGNIHCITQQIPEE
jgi:agmatine deiminase